jgi:DNA-binding MarR family transcriptional regulator
LQDAATQFDILPPKPQKRGEGSMIYAEGMHFIEARQANNAIVTRTPLKVTDLIRFAGQPFLDHSQQRIFAFTDMSCHDLYMNVEPLPDHPDLLLLTLADFRFELRRFLQFSESAAMEVGLQPRQHQLLLQVAGAPEGTALTIAYAAGRLGIKHNSAVELVDRSEREGLLIRLADAEDKRRAILRVTRKGKQVLRRLSGDHARELNQLAPRLIKALNMISIHAQTTTGAQAQ